MGFGVCSRLVAKRAGGRDLLREVVASPVWLWPEDATLATVMAMQMRAIPTRVVGVLSTPVRTYDHVSLAVCARGWRFARLATRRPWRGSRGHSSPMRCGFLARTSAVPAQ